MLVFKRKKPIGRKFFNWLYDDYYCLAVTETEQGNRKGHEIGVVSRGMEAVLLFYHAQHCQNCQQHLKEDGFSYLTLVGQGHCYGAIFPNGTFLDLDNYLTYLEGRYGKLGADS
jgi:hypothetical protein